MATQDGIAIDNGNGHATARADHQRDRAGWNPQTTIAVCARLAGYLGRLEDVELPDIDGDDERNHNRRALVARAVTAVGDALDQLDAAIAAVGEG